MKATFLAVVAVLVLARASTYAGQAADSSLFAKSPPVLRVTTDGETQTVPYAIAGSIVRLPRDEVTLTFSKGDTVTIKELTADSDPVLLLTALATDIGAPSNFVFAVNFPILPLSGPSLVRTRLRGDMTDGTNDGVSIAPFTMPTVFAYSVNGVPGTNVGADLGPALGPVAPGSTAPYGPFESDVTFDCTPPCTAFGLSLGFTGSGGRDRYELFSSYEIAQQCSDGGECASGFCASGVCCDRACSGAGEVCNASGLLGICTQAAAAPAISPSALLLLVVTLGTLAGLYLLRRRTRSPD
jgi:hypothetical protein